MYFSLTKNTSVLLISSSCTAVVDSFWQTQEALQQCTGELELFLRPSKHYDNQASLDFFDRSHAECFMPKLTANHNTGQIHLPLRYRFCWFWHWRDGEKVPVPRCIAARLLEFAGMISLQQYTIKLIKRTDVFFVKEKCIGFLFEESD